MFTVPHTSQEILPYILYYYCFGVGSVMWPCTCWTSTLPLSSTPSPIIYAQFLRAYRCYKQHIQSSQQSKTTMWQQLYLVLHLKYIREALGRDTCTPKLIAAVLCGQDMKLKKMSHVHALVHRFHLALKKNTILSFAGRWIEVETK